MKNFHSEYLQNYFWNLWNLISETSIWEIPQSSLSWNVDSPALESLLALQLSQYSTI